MPALTRACVSSFVPVTQSSSSSKSWGSVHCLLQLYWRKYRRVTSWEFLDSSFTSALSLSPVKAESCFLLPVVSFLIAVINSYQEQGFPNMHCSNSPSSLCLLSSSFYNYRVRNKQEEMQGKLASNLGCSSLVSDWWLDPSAGGRAHWNHCRWQHGQCPSPLVKESRRISLSFGLLCCVSWF